jgi:predicted permease
VKLTQFFRRLRMRRRRDQLDHTLREEMQQHVELLTAELVARGTSPEEARLTARRRFGNPTLVREQSRDWWGFPSFESFLQDLRFGLRLLLRSPAVSLLAIATLALGIGANTAVFSAVNALLLRPLPFAQPERLVTAWSSGGWTYVPLGVYLAYAERTRTMDLAACGAIGANLTGQGEAVRLDSMFVSANFFSMLGVNPEIGRSFQAGENLPGSDRVVILSHALWQSRFHSDRNILGRMITLDGVDREVVGVMPRDFDFPRKTELWIPYQKNNSNAWGMLWVAVLGRLRPGVSLDNARAELKTLTPQIVPLIPWHMPAGYAKDADVLALQEQMVAGFRTKLLLLLGAVGLVLLIACANVANLLLARAAGREREMAVRTALGAGRARLLRQLITESILLAGLGGGAGLLLAAITTAMLRDRLPKLLVSGYGFGLAASPAVLDGRVLAFVCAIALSTGIVFGLAPAFRVRHVNVEQALKANVRASSSRHRRRLSSVLVICETALAMLLAVAAGLLVRSLWQLSHEAPGFNPHALLTASFTPSMTMCPSQGGISLAQASGANRCAAFYDALLARVRSTPGVESAAFSDCVPYGKIRNTVIAAEDNPHYSADSPYQVLDYNVSPTYFQTLSIPLLRGRSFTEHDDLRAPAVVIVSRDMAERLWPGQNPIGKRVKPSWMNDWREVVGEVADVRPFGMSPGAWADPAFGAIYFPYRQGLVGPPPWLVIVIRTSNAGGLATALPAMAAEINPNIPVTEISTMQQVISESITAPRSITWLFGGFSALALVLGAIGLYSLISYSVTSHTHEIGIRMALGAERATVLRSVLLQGLALAGTGVLIGLVAAILVGSLLQSLLYGVQPSDPATFAGVAVVLILVALAAAYIPARRAASIAPMSALRYE